MVTTSSGQNQTIPVSGVSGHTSGSITGSFQVSTGTAGNYTFQVWVVDSDGSASNHLSGTFDVAPVLGTAWTGQSSGTMADLHRVTWSGSRYVAVGASGTIVSSTDGISWTVASSGTTNSLYGITWTGSHFIAVGDQGTVLASPDGMAWTALNIGRTDVTLLAVVQGGTELVVVGGQGTGNGANPGSLSSLILSTADEITWTERPTSMSTWAFYGVAWSGKTFVAIGQSSTAFSGDVIWTSPDGITWSSTTINTSTGMHQLYDLIWTGSNFVSVGHVYGLLSSDGTTWQAFGPLSGGNTSFGLYASGVAYANGNYLAVGDAYGQVETSLDALNWTEATPAPGLGTLYGAAGGNSQFVAVGKAGAVFTSP
jgi:hypothetical protein